MLFLLIPQQLYTSQNDNKCSSDADKLREQELGTLVKGKCAREPDNLFKK